MARTLSASNFEDSPDVAEACLSRAPILASGPISVSSAYSPRIPPEEIDSQGAALEDVGQVLAGSGETKGVVSGNWPPAGELN